MHVHKVCGARQFRYDFLFPSASVQGSILEGKRGLGFGKSEVAGTHGVGEAFGKIKVEHWAMRFLLEMVESRREFFRAGLRYSFAALLTAVASQAARNPKLAGQRCVNSGICPNCVEFATCGLPQALSARAKGARG